jgi:hypothetical protein
VISKTTTKFAKLALTGPIDYERLYKPNETFIRIDLSCHDGKYSTQSKILINVQDMNDNKPSFPLENKNLTIKRNESSLLETLVQLKASDMDLSPHFGNLSLFYSISYCFPNIYSIYIDERTGEINSKLVIDLDTDEIISKRREMTTMLNTIKNGSPSSNRIPSKILFCLFNQ